MNILVTGGAGFVGANIAAALAGMGRGGAAPGAAVDRGHALNEARIVVADLPLADAGGAAALQRFLASGANHVTVAVLDVLDRQQVYNLVARERITHIVHAAAITVGEEEERRRAVEVVDVNLCGAINVLAAAAGSTMVERVLLLSSSGLYGAPSRSATRGSTYNAPFAQRETGPLDLGNLYSITKYSAELLAARYAELTGKPMASLRVPAVYGPLERSRPSRPQTSTLRQLMDALQQRQPITVSGRSVSRDWTYVADIGAAVGALLTAPRWQWSVYNAGCGRSTTFADVVAAFAAHGLSATWVGEQERADVRMVPSQERMPLDISRLREDTGYRPQFDLASGLAAWLAAEPLR
jgi:UDP-glucose 4-epimerase